MPRAPSGEVHLHYETYGEGDPLILVHEFADDLRGWDPQIRSFSRRYRVIVYNARGYPPSDVPPDSSAYSQQAASEDIHALMRHLDLRKAHLCGTSMGAFAALHFGLTHPEMARSLVLAACGYGAEGQEEFRQDSERLARRIETEGMEAVAAEYARRPARLPYRRKDPKGWAGFAGRLAEHAPLGMVLTLRRILARRPSVYELKSALETLTVPTLIINGDEDAPTLQPGLFLKRTIRSAALLVLPRTGHNINLEEAKAFNRAISDFFTLVEAGRWAPGD